MGQLKIKVKSSNLCNKLMAKPEIELPCLLSYLWNFLRIYLHLSGRESKSSFRLCQCFGLRQISFALLCFLLMHENLICHVPDESGL